MHGPGQQAPDPLAADRVAIVTGASQGLGLALARALARQGWRLVIDARGAERLARAEAELSRVAEVHAPAGGSRVARVQALAGDVSDPGHRRSLVVAAGARIDLLVNNASVLGPSPQPRLLTYPPAELERVLRVNLLAPLALIQLALGLMDGGCVINVTSDAAIEPYPGWGGYGASKAALEQLTAVLGAEHPELRVYAVDPGDMRTSMHQQAFPGEDISDRPPPEQSVPGLLALIDGSLPSGRYRAHELAAVGR